MIDFTLNNKIEQLYYTFRIPKGNGKYRKITAPVEELKQAQREVLKELSYIKVSRSATGFTDGQSIITNARKHTRQPYILNIDLKDFFPSITKEMVLQALIREGVEGNLAHNISILCTLHGVLPQGAPTSPFLSNIVTKPMDKKITKICGNVTYTRYADDMTFSGEMSEVKEVVKLAFDIIKSYGLKINYDKIHGSTMGMRQEVTGIIVNQKPNISRDNIMKFRAQLHNIKCAIKDGYIKSEEDMQRLFNVDIQSVRGYASFITSANPKKGAQYTGKVSEIQNMI